MIVDQQKNELRQRVSLLRAGAQAASGEAAARAIAQIGLDFLDLPVGAIISGYAAIADELNPLPLLQRLHDDGLALALPGTVGKGMPLVFRAWQPGDAMEPGFMGISEPKHSAQEVVPDVVLCPLLAFDAAGYRLGYGGGHYDRTLARLRHNKTVVAIGLAFDEQKVDVVPQDRYDQQLDWVLTPQGARHCREL